MNTAKLPGTVMSQLEQRADSSGWIVSLCDAAEIETGESKRIRKEFSSAAAVRTGRARALRLLGEPGCALPASAEGASCVVIFDGVLYNRAELGERFGDSRTPESNDASLVLQAYLGCGEDVLHKIKGVFALIIWDDRQDILLCARDPLGIYPLSYAAAGRELLLSTSIEALVQHPGVSVALNRAALAHHLCHRFPNLEETYFTAVNRVPPGHAMRVGCAGRQVFRYWNPVPPGVAVNWINEEGLERFDGLLDQAVNRCLEQGPAGIYLSGGLDSVAVAAVAAENSRRRGLPIPWALSLVFPHPDCNEEVIQRNVASSLALPQKMVSIGDAVGPEGLLWSAMEMSAQRPAPMLNLWNPAYYYLALQGRRNGCQVILTGSGGDEWFDVSPFYAADLIRALDILGLYRLWDGLRRSYPVPRVRLARFILWKHGAHPLMGTFAARALRGVAPDVLGARRRRNDARETPQWLAPDPTLRQELYQRCEQSRRELDPEDGFYVSETRRALDSRMNAVELEEVFESGRRLGVRVLAPFWDAELADLLCRTPPHLLLKGGRIKGLVRQSLARRFPDLGFERQKKVVATGFFNSVLMTEGVSAWQKMCGGEALAKLGIVDARGLSAHMAELFGGTQLAHVHRIWKVLSVEAWLRPRV